MIRKLFNQKEEGCIQDSVQAVRWKESGERFMLELPQGFHEMTDEKKKAFYPFDNRPEVILEEDGDGAQFTFQFLDKKLKGEDIRKAIGQVRKLTEDTFPEYKVTEEHLNMEGEIIVGWFCVQMERLGKEHMKAVFSVESQMALLTMTYPEEKEIKWRAVVRHMFRTLKYLIA